MGNIGTAKPSNLVTAHGIFNNNTFMKRVANQTMHEHGLFFMHEYARRKGGAW